MGTLQTQRRRSPSIVAVGLIAALFSACSSSVPTDDTHKNAQPLFFPPNGVCQDADDCVSGLCRNGQCAICGTVDFDRDSGARPVTRGKIVENIYSPVSIRAFKDPLRITRGLGVAYSSPTAPRLKGQGNVLISQASFTDADVARGFVDSPAPQTGASAFDFDFSEPVCTDSFTFLALRDNKLGGVDLFDDNGFLVAALPILDTGGRSNVSLGSKCGVKRMIVKPLDQAAIDDVRICGLGKAPPASSPIPGQTCGVDVIQSQSAVQDPCINGVALATKKLRPLDRTATLSFSATATSTLCVRLAGETRRTQNVALDGQNLATNDDGVSPLEVRAAVAGGTHTVNISTNIGLRDVDVTVLSSPGSFDTRIPVRKDGLLVTNTDESPDVLNVGGRVTLSATARVGRISLSPIKFFYEFQIYAPNTCAKVAEISGTKDATPDAPMVLTAEWDGKDASGNVLPDGDYLWNVRVKAVPILDLLKKTEVTTSFRSVRIFGQVRPKDCRQRIRDAIAASSLPDPNNRFDVTRDLLRCGADTATPCEIDFFTVLNLQRRQVADKLANDQISPAEFLHFQRDRSRKADLADDDATWVLEFCRGDADADLVPDSRDRCPDTPPLTATDDQGCTDSNLPPAPPREDVRKILSGLQISYAPGCPMGRQPKPSRIVSACHAADKSLHVTVQPEGTMPADCPVWYIVRGTLVAAVDPLTNNDPLPRLSGFEREYAQFALGPPLTPTVVPNGLEFRITLEQLKVNIVPPNHALRFWSGITGSVETLTGAGHRSQIGSVEKVRVLPCR